MRAVLKPPNKEKTVLIKKAEQFINNRSIPINRHIKQVKQKIIQSLVLLVSDRWLVNDRLIYH